jgi:hypothetical protein
VNWSFDTSGFQPKSMPLTTPHEKFDPSRQGVTINSLLQYDHIDSRISDASRRHKLIPMQIISQSVTSTFQVPICRRESSQIQNIMQTLDSIQSRRALCVPRLSLLSEERFLDGEGVARQWIESMQTL